MGISMQDVGEVAYGGVVTLAEWMDAKRIKEAKLKSGDVLKKYSTWTYLGIGLFATLSSAFGWLRRYEGWMEHVSHGFLYDLPRFSVNLVKAMEKTSTSGDAISMAQRIMRDAAEAKALGAGRVADRSYQQEFQKVGIL